MAAACLKAKLVRGRLAYGLYWGPIANGSEFSGRPFTHHAWVELPDGQVWDPTRWVFEGRAPFIYMGPAGEDYDFGGNRLLAATRGPAPAPGVPRWRLRLPAEVRRGLGRLLGYKEGAWDGAVNGAQVFWLGNLPLGLLGAHARPLYRELVRLGRGAVIPLDNRQRVLEGCEK